MDRDELLARLQRHEWNDVECKRAQRGVSDEAYFTVSAFSNTAGGSVVHGLALNA
jgi:ATP-dependent DNA helicase RecG